MKPKPFFAAPLLAAAIALSGCAGGLYEAKSWISPGGDSVIADWDVASAKCEAEALDETADEEEKKSAQEAAQGGATLGRALSGAEPDYGAQMLSGALIGVMPYMMDESAKNKRFIECMEELGWEKAEK